MAMTEKNATCHVCGNPLADRVNAATCGGAACVAEHKKQLKQRHRKENLDKYRVWNKEYYHRNKKPKKDTKPKGLLNKELALLKLVMKQELINALVRENKFKCQSCKKILGLIHKSASRQPLCKPCITKQQREWKKRNPEKVKAYARKTYKRIKKDNAGLMIKRFRDSTGKHAKRAGIRGCVKGKKLEYLGCTAQELCTYLETQFQNGMTWNNYGHKSGVRCWEIDHIKPVSKYDLAIEKERRECFHYTNLQPMWVKDNQRKGNRSWKKHAQPLLLL